MHAVVHAHADWHIDEANLKARFLLATHILLPRTLQEVRQSF